MLKTRPQYSLRILMQLTALVAISLGMLRVAYQIDKANPPGSNLLMLLLGLAGLHLLFGTVGGSLAGVAAGRRSALGERLWRWGCSGPCS